MVKFFSNFDTNLYDTLLAEKHQEFNSKDVLGMRRGHIFFWFEIFPSILSLLILLVGVWIGPLLFDMRYVTQNIMPYTVFLVIQVAFTFVLIRMIGGSIFKLYMDYKLDFAIITPIELISYNQTDIFTRSSKTIKTDNIKTISLDKKGFLKSVFNYGTLMFLSEGDDAGKGELDLYYISSPEQVKNEISRIISLGEGYQSKS